MFVRIVGAYSTTFPLQNVKASSASGILEQIGPLLESSDGGHTPRVPEVVTRPRPSVSVALIEVVG